MLRASQLLRSSTDIKKAKRISETGEETNPKVLVVTGDSSILRILEDSVTEMGYEVTGVRDRSQAEEYLNRRKPVMIICDADLPADDAYNLCHLVKRAPSTTSIPFVFITNKGEFPDKKLGFESGADDYITKPLDSTEVKSRVGPLLRRGKIGKREEFSREEKKALRDIPEPKDVLSEILAREKAGEESGKGKTRLSSMDLIKEKLEYKTKGEEETKGEAELPREQKAEGDAETLKEEGEKATEQIKTVYQDSIRALTEWIDSIIQGKLADVAEVEGISGNLLGKMNSDFLLLNMVPESGKEKDLAQRSVNTAILSLRTGKRLGYSDGKLTRLGVAALLHLVGLRKLLGQPGQGHEDSRSEEQRNTKDYPSVGAELLRVSVEKYGGKEYSWLLDVITQIEEREDGQGFPRGLKGNQIHEYAKIIAVVKRYLDFIYPFSPTERIIPSEAIKRIIQMQKNALSPRIVGVFVKEISIFPVGSWIQLNNGEIGMVVSNDSSHPLRPIVKVLYGSEGEALSSEQELNLAEIPFVFVSKPIDEGKILKKK